MTNPFRNDPQNPYDLPLVGGKLQQTGAQQDANAVLYDPVTDSVNPAGVALIQTIMKQVHKQVPDGDIIASVMAKQIAKHVQPQLDRIDVLERALDVRKADTAAAIQKHIDQFTGDDAPLDQHQLEQMAEAHAKSMRERGIAR